jgi:hypothetical protein
MQLITLTFNTPLHPGNITAFRAAMAECAGLEHELFHQHDNSSDAKGQKLHWKYPLIQYRVAQGLAKIVGINAGADAIRKHLLPNLPSQITCAGQIMDLSQCTIHKQDIPLSITDSAQAFGVYGWLALNKQNYETWQKGNDEVAQLRTLDQAITGHLRAFAEGVDLSWAKLIQANITAILDVKKVKWHGTDLVRFDVQVESCFVPPPEISIGRMSAYGFGEVMAPEYFERATRLRSRKRNMRNNLLEAED